MENLSLSRENENRKTERGIWDSNFHDSEKCNIVTISITICTRRTPSRAKMIVHRRRKQKDPRKPALCNWLRFSLETIMSYRCHGCRPVTRRNRIIVGLEDTNKSGISRHCGRHGGAPSSAVTFNHQGRNFLVPLRRYKLIIHVRLRQTGPGRL